MIYFFLFWEFFKTGLFSIGGGLATIPFLYDIAARYDWLSAENIPHMLAIAESTPGPIGVNLATFAGYSAAGIPGGVVATFSLSLPAYIVIVLIFRFLEKFRDNWYVESAFYAVRPAVAALILSAGWLAIRPTLFPGSFSAKDFDLLSSVNFVPLAIFAAAIVIRRLKDFHPLWFILGGSIIGIVLQM